MSGGHLEDLAAGLAPVGTDRDDPTVRHRDAWDGEPLVGADWRVRGDHAVPFDALPLDLRAACLEVSEDHGRLAGQLKALVRWHGRVPALPTGRSSDVVSEASNGFAGDE